MKWPLSGGWQPARYGPTMSLDTRRRMVYNGIMTTWRKELTYCFKRSGDTPANLEFCTLSEDELDVEFDNDLGVVEGKPFVAHTLGYVYFSFSYDGSEWVNYVPRHPTGELVEPLRRAGYGD